MSEHGIERCLPWTPHVRIKPAGEVVGVVFDCVVQESGARDVGSAAVMAADVDGDPERQPATP